MDIQQTLREKRDIKAIPHLEQYAPVWLVDEKFISEDNAIQFNVIFQHAQYAWVNRRYRYDGFNNVLYLKGQTMIDEGTLAALQEQEPYIAITVADIPNSYGG